MKKLITILITFVLLAVVIVCSLLYQKVPNDATEYINTQKEQQRLIAERQVDSLFVHKHTDIFPIYSECKSRFVKGDASSQTGSLLKDIIYGHYQPKMPADITSTYCVAPENPLFITHGDIIEEVKTEIRMNNSDNDGPENGIHGANWKGLWQTGWALGVRENWGSGKIAEYLIIPYAVSFRKQSFGSLEDYISIDNILNNAFEFYTNNEKSNFKRNIVANTHNYTHFPYINNEYYHLERIEKAEFITFTVSDYADYTQYMYTDSYYVFIRGYGKKMYELVLDEDHVNGIENQYITRNRHLVVIHGLISFGVVFVLWIIFLFLIIKERKENRRTLLQRIIAKSNPKNYIKVYNKEKLKSANAIYSKAISTEITDETTILELAERVENELDEKLVSKTDINNLKKICNPRQFMNPYDAEKVAIANELYGRIKSSVLSYSDYIKIKKDIDELYGK